ncbi:MAG: ABC transporter substrate-binding protein [Chloroflexota bacterium]
MTNDPIKFVVGGPVQVSQGTYISRSEADEALFQACLGGEFAYILASRQIGKSSLMHETAHRLLAEKVRVVRLDLNRIGTDLEEADSWYLSFCHVIARQLRLTVDLEAWWAEQPRHSGNTQRFLTFFDEVVLSQIAEPIVFFVDEIDMTLAFDFTDDFFAAIRVMYNERAQNPAYQRLTFVLLGVATPDELIEDHTRTPFNIGQRIILQDFTQKQCIPFREALQVKYGDNGATYFDQIYDWTRGHPYLTQKLCQEVITAADEAENLVEKVVKATFLPEEAGGEDNLQFVQDRVLADPQAQAMLRIYRQILQGKKPVLDEEQSLAKNRLKLYGLVLPRNGNLQVRNKIYAKAFNLDWVKRNLVSNRALYIAFAIIVVLMITSAYFALLNRQIENENQQITAAISAYQTQIQNARDETMETEYNSLIGLLKIAEERPDQLTMSEVKTAYESLSFAQQLFLFENAVSYAPPEDYKSLVTAIYLWSASNEENNHLLSQIPHFSRNYKFDSEIRGLNNQIKHLVEARDHIARQQWTQAEEIYTNLLEYGARENPFIYLERGQTRQAQQKWLDSLADFEQFLGLNPVNIDPIREQLQSPDLRQALEAEADRFPALSDVLASLVSTAVAALPTLTPTSTPTNTPTFTPIPTSTPTSTGEATIASSTVIATATPVSENLEPASSAAPITYDAPTLGEPANGVGRLASFPKLTWKLEYDRLKSEQYHYYRIRIWNEAGFSEMAPFLVDKETLDLNFIYPENGIINWSVSIVEAKDVTCNEGLCSGDVTRVLSKESEAGWFVYDNLGRVGSGVVQLPTAAVQLPTAVVQLPPVTGKTRLRLAFGNLPSTLDPHRTNNAFTSEVLHFVCESLSDLMVNEPHVADDSKSVTVSLRDNVIFSDGTPFDAEAVIYSFERLQESASAESFLYENVQGITFETPDPYTVIFQFAEANENYDDLLDSPLAAIISPNSDEATIATAPICTGPYTVAEWVADQFILLTKNESHTTISDQFINKGPAYIDEIKINLIQTHEERIEALLDGIIDTNHLNTKEDLERVKEQSDRLRLRDDYWLGGISYLGFNYAKSPTDNLALRQALAHGVDKQALIDKVLAEEFAIPAVALISPRTAGYSDEIAVVYEFDLDKSRELLAEAGFVDSDGDGQIEWEGEPLTLDMVTTTDNINFDMAVSIQEWYDQLGITVTIRQHTAKEIAEITPTGDFDLLLYGYNWASPTALNIFFGSDRIGGANRVAYSNPEVDELLAETAGIPTDPENEAPLKEKLLEAQEMILRDLPWQPILARQIVSGVNRRVQGEKVMFNGFVLWHDAQIVE